MDETRRDLLKGTLDMLILQALEHEPMHGWGIAERLESHSKDTFVLQTGTIYPALHRLLRKGWIVAAWETTEHNREARFYRLTPGGRKQLQVERDAWKRASTAVNRILDALS